MCLYKEWVAFSMYGFDGARKNNISWEPLVRLSGSKKVMAGGIDEITRGHI